MNLMIEACIYAVLMIAGGFVWGQQFEANKWRLAMRPIKRRVQIKKRTRA